MGNGCWIISYLEMDVSAGLVMLCKCHPCMIVGSVGLGLIDVWSCDILGCESAMFVSRWDCIRNELVSGCYMIAVGSTFWHGLRMLPLKRSNIKLN